MIPLLHICLIMALVLAKSSLAVEMPKIVQAAYYGEGLFLDDKDQTALEKASALAKHLKTNFSHINAIVLDISDSTGVLGQLSEDFVDFEGYSVESFNVFFQKTYHEKASHKFKDFVKIFQDNGFYFIVMQSVFRNKKVVKLKPEWAVKDIHHYKDDKHIWGYQGHQNWLNPFNHSVHVYIIVLTLRVFEDGADMVLYDFIRFPRADSGIIQNAYYPGQDDQSHHQAIDRFLKTVKEKRDEHFSGKKIGASVFSYTSIMKENKNDLGQNIKTLSHLVDVISPMNYPSQWDKKSDLLGLDVDLKDPGSVVFAAVSKLKNNLKELVKLGQKETKVLPWIQSFDLPKLWSSSFVNKQICSSIKAGAMGYMIWGHGENLELGLKASRKRC